MTRKLQPSVTLFAVGMIAFGLFGLVTGGFAAEWQPVIAWLPARTLLAYVSAGLMLGCGAGLLLERTASWSVRILFPVLVVWQLLKLPELVRHPGIEVSYESFAEAAVPLAGSLVLLALLGGVLRNSRRGLRLACAWFGAWLIPVGLSHFFYSAVTFSLVPAWMPWRHIWGPVTGAGQIACGLSVLFRVLPRAAAVCEAAMISLFTVLIWLPAVARAPRVPDNWSELCVSVAFAAGAWVVAQGMGSAADGQQAGAEA